MKQLGSMRSALVVGAAVTAMSSVSMGRAALVGYYPLDGNAQNVVPDSPATLPDGIVSNEASGGFGGGSVWATDPTRGMVFGSSGPSATPETHGEIDAGPHSAAFLNGSWTMSFWTDLRGTSSLIVGHRTATSPGAEWWKVADTEVTVRKGDLRAVDRTVASLVDAGWVHHALVHEGSSADAGVYRYYRDGALVFVTDPAAPDESPGGAPSDATWLMTDSHSFGIGGDPIGRPSEAATGFIDDVAIWDEVLSAARIAELAAGAPVPEPSSLSLAALGGLALLARRRRRR